LGSWGGADLPLAAFEAEMLAEEERENAICRIKGRWVGVH
jgi:hypothetical protein